MNSSVVYGAEEPFTDICNLFEAGSSMIVPILLMLNAAVAQIDNPYPPDADCTAQDTVGMIACQKRDLATWDARLNDEYEKAVGRVGVVSRTKLRQAQRFWLRYRDANCEVYESHGGTIHFLLGSACVIRMTKERTLELRGFDAGFE